MAIWISYPSTRNSRKLISSFINTKKSPLIDIIILLDSIDIHENHRKGEGYYAYINRNIISVKSFLFLNIMNKNIKTNVCQISQMMSSSWSIF